MKSYLSTLLLALTASFTLAQGPLTPPGLPAPSMKTLDQIEARTPIPKTSAIPIAGPHFIISQPGSYYLTGNITVSSEDGIRVASDDVTLDLNGFTIRSTLEDVDIGAGIRVLGLRSNLSVRNGCIVSGSIVPENAATIEAVGFVNGIGPLNEISDRISQLTVTDVQVRGVASIGILGQVQSTLTRCGADSCGEIGLVGDIVRDCTAARVGSIGILAGNATNSSAASFGGIGFYIRENANNCHGSGTTGTGLQVVGNASQCSGSSTQDIGLMCQGNASDCTGKSEGLNGWGLFCGGNATNCHGRGENNSGLYCEYNATNCTGRSITAGATGLDCRGNATNCTGLSGPAANGIGLRVLGNATNCYGLSLSLPAILCSGTATSCRGKRDGAVAIQAAIAVSCTVEGTGTIFAPSKHLGTP
jgi:hypothetical protein